MPGNLLKVSASKLILKINIITGWAIPEEDIYEMFKEELELKLKESYPNVNVDEMIYAFRNNTTVKDWGRNMNLAMIDEVMIPYLDKRREVSRIEEQQQKELPPPNTEEMLTDDEFIQMNFKIWQTLKKRGMIAPKVYYLLVKKGKIVISAEDKQTMYEQAEAQLKARVEEEKRVMSSGKKMAYDHEIINISKDPDRWQTRVFTECKQMAVENYFKSL